MNVKKKISIVALAVAMTMMFTLGGTISIFAADQGSVAWDVQKSKTATTLNSKNQTTVTLSLPSAEYNSKADVVFVLDKSTSGNIKKAKNAAKAMVDDLAKKNNVDIKIGVVVFNRDVTVNLDLTKLTSENVETIKKDIDLGADGGSNTQGGLLKADEMLAADPDVSNSNKYVVYVTDGIGYVWGAQGHPKTTAYAYAETKDQTSFGNPTTSTFESKIEKTGKEPSFTEVYDNAAMEKASEQYYTDYASDIPESKCIPYKEIPNTFSSVESAIYLSAHTYKDLTAKYNCISLWYTPYGLENPEYRLAQGYMKWTGTITNSKAYCLDNNADTTAKTAFDTLENKLIYALNSGTVTDTITDSFDLVQSEVPFTLTVGGKELTGIKTAKDEYSFGVKDSQGVYPYAVKLSGRTFVWTINVPIEKTAPVQLSYKLQLNNLKKSGTFDTNVSALLNAKDSNGNVTAKDDPFPIPSVSYVANSNNNHKDNPSHKNNNGGSKSNGSNSNSNGPRTGDNSDVVLWAMLGTAGAALAAVLVALRRRTE